MLKITSRILGLAGICLFISCKESTQEPEQPSKEPSKKSWQMGNIRIADCLPMVFLKEK
ncbi:hypothetical protein V8V91_10800 [Algoriphagus halophilus]|uniref:hypothetical protein n=1 Tax=Algoriphagus halophilus TaxID=226505 RepID=UPI00358FD83E